MITNRIEILVQRTKNNVCLWFNLSFMKPQATDYPSFYAPYLAAVENKNLEQLLEQQIRQFDMIFSGITEEQANATYAPGKWSMKEVLGHILDAERIFAYRALSFARGEQQAQPGFDEDSYVAAARFNHQSVDDLLFQLMYTRKSTLLLLRSLSEETLSRSGTANGKQITVNALFWIIAGHAQHHLHVLQERYLTSSGSTVQV